MIDRARYILKTEGLGSLLGKGFRFVVGPIFKYETFYLYEYILEDLRDLKESDFKPKIDDFTFKIVSTHQEADRLEAEGFELRATSYPWGYPDPRKLLDRGLILTCTFAGRELASIGSIAMTKEAADTPQKVDFSNNEVYPTAAWTNPKYRRMGFHKYCSFKRRQFDLSQGKTVSRFSVVKSNIALQLAEPKISRKYGEARCLKIMRWTFWREEHSRG